MRKTKKNYLARYEDRMEWGERIIVEVVDVGDSKYVGESCIHFDVWQTTMLCCSR